MTAFKGNPVAFEATYSDFVSDDVQDLLTSGNLHCRMYMAFGDEEIIAGEVADSSWDSDDELTKVMSDGAKEMAVCSASSPTFVAVAIPLLLPETCGVDEMLLLGKFTWLMKSIDVVFIGGTMDYERFALMGIPDDGMLSALAGVQSIVLRKG